MRTLTVLFFSIVLNRSVNSCDIEQFDNVDTLNIWKKAFGLLFNIGQNDSN